MNTNQENTNEETTTNNNNNAPILRQQPLRISLNPSATAKQDKFTIGDVEEVQISPNRVDTTLINLTIGQCIANNGIETTDGNIVNEIENEELTYLGDKSSETYTTLYGMLKEVGEACKCNFIVYAGHGATCEQRLERNTFTLTNKNQYPTIILLIGCKTGLSLEKNKDQEFRRHKVYVMGFTSSSVHMIKGHILMTDQWSKKEQIYECDTMKENNTATLEACCKARWGQIKNNFIEKTILDRNIHMLTKEDLIKKIKSSLQTSSSQFKNHNEIPPENFKITKEDGTRCTKENPCIPGPHYEENMAFVTEFNQKMKPQFTVKKIIRIFKTGSNIYVQPILRHVVKNEDRATVENELLNIFKDLTTTEAIEALNFKVDFIYTFPVISDEKNTIEINKTPLFFKCILEKYVVHKIFKEYSKVDWEATDVVHNNILHYIVQKANFLYELNKDPRYTNTVYIQYKIPELYRLFLDIYSRNKKVFWMQNDDGFTPFVYLLNDVDNFFPLIEFYFKEFPPSSSNNYLNHTSEPNTNNALHILLKNIGTTLPRSERTIKVIQFLLNAKVHVEGFNAIKNELNNNTRNKMIKANVANYNEGYMISKTLTPLKEKTIKQINSHFKSLADKMMRNVKSQVGDKIKKLYTASPNINEGKASIHYKDQLEQLVKNIETINTLAKLNELPEVLKRYEPPKPSAPIPTNERFEKNILNSQGRRILDPYEKYWPYTVEYFTILKKKKLNNKENTNEQKRKYLQNLKKTMRNQLEIKKRNYWAGVNTTRKGGNYRSRKHTKTRKH